VAPEVELKGDIMRNQIMSWKGLTIVAALTVLAFASAGADDRDHGPSARRYVPIQHGNGFNVSGRFSGSLAGDIMVNGMTYHLTDKTALYELGRGPIDLGETVTDRLIFMSGSRRDGNDTIYSVIIRPLTDSTDPVREPTEMDRSTPQ
jgi:hypothetical protein